MSVQAMAWVLEHSKATLAPRLVAMAIANHALPCGCHSFPSVRQIGAEARLGRSTVLSAIQYLVAIDELEVTRRASDRRHNCYRLKQVSNCDLSHTEIGPKSRPVRNRIGPDLSEIGPDPGFRALYKNRPNRRARAREALNGPCAVCCEPATAHHRGEWLCHRHWPLEAG